MPPSEAASQYPLPVRVGSPPVDDIEAVPGAAASGPTGAPLTARPTSTSPLLKSVPVPAIRSAVLSSRAATCGAVSTGFAAHNRPAAAETIGDAKEVPSGVPQQFSSQHSQDNVRTP